VQAIHIHPYYVAVNLVEVARVFVAEWDHSLEGTYGRTMQQNWMLYRADPSRFTVAWQDKVMEQGAARLLVLVRDLHTKSTSDATASSSDVGAPVTLSTDLLM
jgi:hypothetical protein